MLKKSVRVMIAVLVAGALLWPELAAPVPGAAQAEDDPRFGLVNAYEAPSAARETGAAWEVVTFRWADLQPSSAAQWNTTAATEEWLNTARGAGREVVGVLIGTPAWATDGTPEQGVPRGLYLPASDPGNLWAAFLRQAVTYGAARGVNRWVIWNAQDIPGGQPGSTWEGSVEDYYQMVKVSYAVIRDANPNARLHLGGISDASPQWFGRFLDVALDDLTAPASDYYFDVVSLRHFNSPERLYSLMQNVFVAMNQKGIPLKEVWVNETNARPTVDPAVYGADASFRSQPNITQEQQAAYIVQAYALGFSANRGARIAAYRLVDNLDEDGGEAYGLLRRDGSPRPAYEAYRLVVREFSGFVFARRVAEEAHPLIEYVRLTSENKVVHVVWARTADTATLNIPARSSQATLLDALGGRWTIRPEEGEYRVVAPGAQCDDPLEGCLIGGMPWLLIEEGLADPLNETAPPVTVSEGGEMPPLEGFPTATAVPTPTGTPSPAVDNAGPVVTNTPLPSASPPTATPVPLPDQDSLRPAGLAAVLPLALVILGVLVIGGGIWYTFSGVGKGRQQT